MLLTTQPICVSTGPGKAHMTDGPGNFSQNATIRRTQGLRATGEMRILGCWKYFERYSEKRRVPDVRTQSAFGLRSMWGNPTLVRSCCVQSNFCSVRFAQYFSTRLPVSGLIGVTGNSERCKMTGNEANVGFLATGSGVQQFHSAFFRGKVCLSTPLPPRTHGHPV